jgi:hypothetical protein
MSAKYFSQPPTAPAPDMPSGCQIISDTLLNCRAELQYQLTRDPAFAKIPPALASKLEVLIESLESLEAEADRES